MPNRLNLPGWTVLTDAKPARICRECHQTHIGSWLRHGRLPTIKSE
ncbi:MAG: hypothetical protein KGL39_46240 [Patescibacteria group bacterium]|nr:hypothetical protein [Patescibacteria group bacterium]